MVREWTDARAHESINRMADGLEHPPHLPIPAFGDDQPHDPLRLAVPWIEYLRMGGQRPPSIQRDPAAQPRQRIRIRHARHMRFVRPFHAVARMGQQGGKIAVVGQDEQALRVVVKPADGVDVLGHASEQVHDGATPLRVAERRDDAARLVEQDVAAAGIGLDPAPVHPDIVRGEVRLRAQFAHRVAVDCDAAVRDQCFGRTPRGDAGVRENLLYSFFHEAFFLTGGSMCTWPDATITEPTA